MADIFVEIDGRKTQVTKARLFEMALEGIVVPSTKLWYGDKQATCAKINGIIFAQGKPVQDDNEKDEEAGEIFSLKMNELPERPTSRVAIPQRESFEAAEAREEEEEKQQKKIILIVTVVSVFCMLVIVRGLTCFMSDLNTKVKTNAEIKKKGRDRNAEQLPQLPPQETAPVPQPAEVPPAQPATPAPADGSVPGGQPAEMMQQAPVNPQENVSPQAPATGTATPGTVPATVPADTQNQTSDDGMGSTPATTESPSTSSDDGMGSTPATTESPSTTSDDGMGTTPAATESPSTSSDDGMGSTPAATKSPGANPGDGK